jgi:hypothetical protein
MLDGIVDDYWNNVLKILLQFNMKKIMKAAFSLADHELI